MFAHPYQLLKTTFKISQKVRMTHFNIYDTVNNTAGITKTTGQRIECLSGNKTETKTY